MSDEKINYIKTSNQSIIPSLECYGTKTVVRFTGSCLKQNKVIFNHGNIVNIYIVYELRMFRLSSFFTLENCLFGAVSLTKNVDIDKYKHSAYGIEHLSGGTGKNVIIFGVDMSSSIHVDNKVKDILILGKGPTQGLGEHWLTAEKMYFINFTKHSKKFCLSWHYKGVNSYLFVNTKEIHKFKPKHSEIVATSLCLGNSSKDWSVDNMKKKRI